jgi:hypothetical protein
MPCKYCGDAVPKSQKFCSKECYGEYISNTIDTECDFCDEVFEAKPSKNRKYCSRECFGKGNRNGELADCANCGESVWKEQNEIERSDNLFCSKECNSDFQRKSSTTKCKNCSDSVTHLPSKEREFCSRQCSAKYRRERVTVNCSYCNYNIEVTKGYQEKHNAIFCGDECRSDWLSENSLFSTDDNPKLNDGTYSNFGSNWPQTRIDIVEKYNNRCANCNKSAEENGRDMSVHHITPRRHYINSDDCSLEDANREDNLVALCRSCHMKAEYGSIEVEQYV